VLDRFVQYNSVLAELSFRAEARSAAVEESQGWWSRDVVPSERQPGARLRADEESQGCS